MLGGKVGTDELQARNSIPPKTRPSLGDTSNMAMRTCRISKQSLASRWDRVKVVWLLRPISEDGSYQCKGIILSRSTELSLTPIPVTSTGAEQDSMEQDTGILFKKKKQNEIFTHALQHQLLFIQEIINWPILSIHRGSSSHCIPTGRLEEAVVVD
ncbi:hypothetical protein AVEN_135529-1 [Araneus ventricosus]|uniref:Uncharacterized protein n=1 Tax=Araneus ventricosus TaxID=182803 RepID=A0A4Y2HE97_ARAVE|nr:hypothetical protein AVEN_135529-1 [Araneus ventricosus]